jgi:surfeit locus 1 family protein
LSGGTGTKEKRRKALFSWFQGGRGHGWTWTWNEHDLLADGESARLDVAELPGQQQTQEQHDGQSDADRERARHAAAPGAATLSAPEHGNESPSQAAQDADERGGDEVFHAPDYRPARRKRLRFWLVTAAALLTVAATVSLGRWQLSRAAQKEALQAGIDAQKKLPPLDQEAFLALGDPAPALYRPVHLRGLWLAPRTVYLDNRQMRGLAGFYVLTPFAIEDSEQTVMIQRGWVQRNFNERAQLVPVETPSGLVEVTAMVAPPPARLLDLGAADASKKTATGSAPAEASSVAPAPPAPPASSASSASSASAAASVPTSREPAVGSSPIRQNLDLQAFRAETRLPLRTDLTLQQAGPASEGLLRDWPAPALGVEKHYGYAFQWFGLAALVVFLYVWFQLIAPWRKASREHR